jgi:hypothetical protein
MRTNKDYLNIFDQYAKDFWAFTLKRLEDDFKIYQDSEDYEGESFAETLDIHFWSMGCDYVDYAKSITEDFFFPIISEKELESLNDQYMEDDLEHYDLYRFLFETYAIPHIHEIIRANT